MTHDDNIERVLEQWFTEGPRHMPDRLFEGTLERIDALPRRRLADLLQRLPAMHVNLRLAVAAAVLVAVAGLGLAVVNMNKGVGATPSPTPTTLAGSELPTPLLATWRSIGLRVIPRVSQPAPQTLEASADGLLLSTWGGDVISTARVAGDRLILRLQSDFNSPPPSGPGTGTCHAGALGTYVWRLTPGGVRLSLQLLADDCAVRAAMLAGDWIHASCADGSGCIGNLEAGQYESWAFQPFQFNYTVPAGWANTHDDPGSFALRPLAAPLGDGIYLYSNLNRDRQAEDCSLPLDPSEQSPGAEALAAWLASLPGLTSTPPVPVSLGGLNGVRLDLSLAEGWTHTCPGAGGAAIVNTFTSQQSDESIARIGLRGGAHATYILLDYLGSNRQVVGTLLIDVEGSSEAAHAAMLAQAESVIATFKFTNDSKAGN